MEITVRRYLTVPCVRVFAFSKALSVQFVVVHGCVLFLLYRNEVFEKRFALVLQGRGMYC